MRGGVPVLNRISDTPSSARDAVSPSAGSIPSGPERVCMSPMWQSPPRYVPVEIITARALMYPPGRHVTPHTRILPPEERSTSTEVTSACTRVRFS